MILLDTDHVNVLKYLDQPQFVTLTSQVNASADQDIATTIITVRFQGLPQNAFASVPWT